MGRTWHLQTRFTLHHAPLPFDWLEGLKLSDELFARLEALLQMEASLLAEVKAAVGGKSTRELREALRIGESFPVAAVEQAGCEDTVVRYGRQRAQLGLRYADERAQLRNRLREVAKRAALPVTRDERQLYDQIQTLCARTRISHPGLPHSSSVAVEGTILTEESFDLRVLPTLQIEMGGSLGKDLAARVEAAVELSAAYGELRGQDADRLLRLSPDAIRNRQIPAQLCGVAGPGDLQVRVQLGLAEVTNGSGSRRYEVCFGRLEGVGSSKVAHAVLLPPEGTGGHLPRLGLEGVVYQRERWEVRAELFEGLTELGLLLEVRRQAQAGRWPRFVFVRSDDSPASMLLDTRCPFAVELFGERIGNERWLSFEEMYPAPDQLWLRDRPGRYVSALSVELVGADDPHKP